MVEYMESEFSGIFRLKLVVKNIVIESPGTHFMYMRVKIVRSITLPFYISPYGYISLHCTILILFKVGYFRDVFLKYAWYILKL